MRPCLPKRSFVLSCSVPTCWWQRPRCCSTALRPCIRATSEIFPPSGNSPEAHRWSLRDATGEPQEVLVTPRLVVDDMQPLLQAALDGLGCAVLPRLFVHEAIRQGTLVQVLPGWHAPTGVIQAAYASRQGMRPAVRELLDHLAQGFRELARQGRCLLPPEAQPV